MNNPLFCKNLAQAFQFIPRKRIISAQSPRSPKENNSDPSSIQNNSLLQFKNPNECLSPKQIIHQSRERIEDLLLRKGKESKEKKEIEKTKWITERMSHFTYSPKINKRSIKILENRGQNDVSSTEKIKQASSLKKRSNSISVFSNCANKSVNKNEKAADLVKHAASNSYSNLDDIAKSKKIIPQKVNPGHSRTKNKSQPICLMIPSKSDPNYPHDDGFDQSHTSDLVEKDKENSSKNSKKLTNSKKIIKSNPNSCNNSKVLKNSFLTETSIDSAQSKDIARNCSIDFKTARIYKKIIEDRKKLCRLINN